MGVNFMKKILSLVNNKLMGFYLIIAFLVFWEVAPKTGLANPIFVPPFSKVLLEGEQFTLVKILINIAVSMKRVVIGFSISTVLSLPLGFVLAGAFPKVVGFIRPLTLFLSQIPPFILFPIFVIISGPGEKGIYTVIFWSSFWPILFTTIAGVQHVDARLIRCARAMKATSSDIFFKVVLPGAFPTIMTGIRSGLTMSFLMLIGAESLGADSGLGWLIHNSQTMGFIPRIYLGALLVALVGFFLNYFTETVEKNVVDWKEVAEEKTI
jgi:NitT/TauT family transport system permease protein